MRFPLPHPYLTTAGLCHLGRNRVVCRQWDTEVVWGEYTCSFDPDPPNSLGLITFARALLAAYPAALFCAMHLANSLRCCF